MRAPKMTQSSGPIIDLGPRRRPGGILDAIPLLNLPGALLNAYERTLDYKIQVRAFELEMRRVEEQGKTARAAIEAQYQLAMTQLQQHQAQRDAVMAEIQQDGALRREALTGLGRWLETLRCESVQCRDSDQQQVLFEEIRTAQAEYTALSRQGAQATARLESTLPPLKAISLNLSGAQSHDLLEDD